MIPTVDKVPSVPPRQPFLPCICKLVYIDFASYFSGALYAKREMSHAVAQEDHVRYGHKYASIHGHLRIRKRISALEDDIEGEKKTS